MDRLSPLTPLVEAVSIDEAFLDVSDLPEPGRVIAKRLQESHPAGIRPAVLAGCCNQ